MSYDLHIYSPAKPDLKSLLGLSLQQDNKAYVFQDIGWTVTVFDAYSVLEEDMPEEVFRAIPGVSFCTELSLSAGAPSKAEKALHRLAGQIAKATGGAIYDPQMDTLRLRSVAKRLLGQSIQSQDEGSILQMSWWLAVDPLADENRVREFIAVLDRYLPEALPRRYGLFEPPQFSLAKDGEDHLISFLLSEKSGIIWYPSPPVASLWISIPIPTGPHPLGFRTPTLTISLIEASLRLPGWRLAVHRLWLALSSFLNPFYGDIRVLRGWHYSRGRLWAVSAEAGRTDHPVSSWWWKGVPHEIGCACVLGPPYLELWGDFTATATQLGGMAYLTTLPDSSGLGSDLPLPPEGIRLTGDDSKYPETWPFDPPFQSS